MSVRESAYEAVIGLEIHAQLLTQTKLFCGCSAVFGGSDNENTCPVCTGLPGALPVLNRKALELSVRTGLALGCTINPFSVFARKNYFYPDLPKGYQISQYEEPLCSKGFVEFFLDGKKQRVGITRAHMEEDAGKSLHQGDATLIDLNRSSVPLLEIVSEPDMRSPAEAAEYARAIRSILLYSGVCDGNLEEGSMRCDCNVSVRRRGDSKFGTKVELKNINSFRFIEKAIEFEIQRQISLIETNQPILQETRLYDPDKNRTFSMRSKEEAHDYRYFPDPDLLEVRAPTPWVEDIRRTLPEMPLARNERFQREFELPAYDATILTSSREMADYFEMAAEKSNNPKAASNWIMTEVLREINERKVSVSACPVRAEHLGELIQMIDGGLISGKIAKTIFSQMMSTGRDPQALVAEQGLSQVSDEKQIQAWVDQIMTANPKQVDEYRSGREKVFGFFVGQVMRLSKGQANPEMVNQMLVRSLKGK